MPDDPRRFTPRILMKILKAQQDQIDHLTRRLNHVEAVLRTR